MDLLWCCPVLSVLILALRVQEGNGFFPTTLLAELAQDDGVRVRWCPSSNPMLNALGTALW